MSGYMSRIRVYFLNWNKPLNNCSSTYLFDGILSVQVNNDKVIFDPRRIILFILSYFHTNDHTFIKMIWFKLWDKWTCKMLHNKRKERKCFNVANQACESIYFKYEYFIKVVSGFHENCLGFAKWIGFRLPYRHVNCQYVNNSAFSHNLYWID